MNYETVLQKLFAKIGSMRPLHNSGYPKKIDHFDSISNLREPAYAGRLIGGDRKSKDCKMNIFSGCPELCRGLSIGKGKILFYHHFAKRIGNPQRSFPSIHIAGTNGKGSVSLKIAKALEACGLKVGLFTSPHLYCFTERIQINGKAISKDRVVQGLNSLFLLEDIIEEEMGFFDFTTFLAFQYFQEEKIEIAVIETGIGGKEDPTNVVMPLISVITSIGFDHMPLLGDSLEEIAAQKGGIIKPKVPVVVGPFADLKVIRRIAEENDSPLYTVPPVTGVYDKENQKIAERALQVLGIQEEAIQKGIEFRPSCRFEKIGRVIFDVAHNPAGIDRLLEALELEYPGQPFSFVVGISENKDRLEILKKLIHKAVCFYLVEANSSRAASQETLANVLKELNFFQFITPPSIEKALDLSLGQRARVVVCGSFYIMHQAREHILRQKSSDLLFLGSA